MPCDRTRRRKVDPGPAFPMGRIIERVFGVDIQVRPKTR
jgi:hypothetical protein